MYIYIYTHIQYMAVPRWQSCIGSPVLQVIFCLSPSDCHILAVLFCHSFSACPTPVLGPHCPVLAVLYRLPCSSCPVQAVLS